MRVRDQAISAAAVVVAMIAFAAMFWRIRHGVDVTDEGYYAALPARVAMGDRPYVEELNLGINAGLLSYPFVKLHYMIRGFTGIFLFLRILYLFFFAGVGFTAYRLALTRLPYAMAVLVGAACIGYLPYGLPGLSYNTLGAGLLAIGLFLAGHPLLARSAASPRFFRDSFFWAGFAHGGAAFAYPTMAFALVVLGVAIFVFADRRVLSFARYVGGGVAFGVVVAPVFLRAGTANVRLMMLYSGGETPLTQGPSKLEIVQATFTQWTAEHPDFWKHAAIIAVLAILARRFPMLVGFALAYIPLFVRVPVEGIHNSLHYVITFALYAPIFGFALRDRKSAFVILAALWFPSLVAGATNVIWSSQGSRNAGIGLYGGAIISGLLLAMWIRETSQRWSWQFLRPFAALMPSAFVAAMISYDLTDDNYYRESKLKELTARVNDGPYKGLLTTPQRRQWFSGILADTKEFRSNRVLFYYDFPAGYLFAERPPNMASVWIFPHIKPRAEIEAKFFLAHASVGDYVYRFYGVASRHGTAVDVTVADHCEIVAQREGYTIYRVRNLP